MRMCVCVCMCGFGEVRALAIRRFDKLKIGFVGHCNSIAIKVVINEDVKLLLFVQFFDGISFFPFCFNFSPKDFGHR